MHISFYVSFTTRRNQLFQPKKVSKNTFPRFLPLHLTSQNPPNSCFLMPLFSNKLLFVPINTLRSVFFSNRSYIRPTKNYNPNFKILVSSMTTTQRPNEEGIAKRLWVRFNKESILSLYTPFVVSLASGNLKLDTFRQYIAQDVHFLKCFAKAYELAEECADDDDAKVSITELRQSVLEELNMHGSFCQEWGFDVSKETFPNSATLKYTDFLLATASGKIEGVKGLASLATPFEKTKVAVYTIGAMVPCMRLYAFLGNELQSLVDNNGNHHPYKKWIDNYSSDAFQAAALQIEDLLDKLSVSLTGEELDILQKLYHQAMKLELEFFLAQPIDQQIVVPLSKEQNPRQNRLMIFSDFDLTCTVVDSCAILAEIALVTTPKLDQIQPENQNQVAQMPSADYRNIWEALSRQYAEEHEKIMECMLGDQKVEKFNYKGLRKALEQLSDFEKRANMRVIESNVLKGLNLEDITRAGERLIFQDGCMDFFRCIMKDERLNVDVHVLSYCWCGDLIRSAFSSGGIHDLHLHSNEFIYEGLISTGEITRNMESPIDKLQAFIDILKEHDQWDGKNLTVYIGDSVGDLLCLLEADIGILIGSSTSLRRVGTHFGVSFVPLFPGLVVKQREHVEGKFFSWKRVFGIVYTVSSWAEIHAFIVGS
ncbi:bifunctional TH2 protein, mitochondrial-like isoform X2 [Cynara cardunculus var. scolymus]|uniref:bifunctional TH2 protein, mitochondrial-like isoform X2 n=1 Tax=Cynara cardunculus var. scolymus TaxID=59895 RepID=UPI000D6308C2|nr:bifunctional TH2 protein, mitochondrial-like isoform X2 [Cynara cardunculus var. scolymus]